MSQIEISIIILLLLMSVPDICARLGRRALTFPAYIVCGVCFSPFLAEGTRDLMSGIGGFGFILLLFMVGLELDLPGVREIRRHLGAIWRPLLGIYGCVLLVAFAVGLPRAAAAFCAAALTACSISLAHPAMKQIVGLSRSDATTLMTVMVLLEVQAMIFLVAGDVVLLHGVGWLLPSRLLLALLGIALLAFTADHVSRGLRAIIERTSHWKTHMLVVLILLVCALGERLGLPAPKTAFFMGMFLGRTSWRGAGLEEHLAPISHRLLIPVFFVALGLKVRVLAMDPWAMVSAVCAGIFILEVKARLFRSSLPLDEKRVEACLLLVPNLTIVAIAAETLHHRPMMVQWANWILLCGLTMTLLAVARLPGGKPKPEQAPMLSI